MSSKVKGRKDAMSSELRLDGLDVAPGVLETIVTLAAEAVDGIAGVDFQGLAGLMQKAGRAKAVDVASSDEGKFSITVHATVRYGRPLREVAADVQEAVSDALLSQTGQAPEAVDVFIDSIVFP
jgi:uncharacterized alkaline shock family protein YloU